MKFFNFESFATGLLLAFMASYLLFLSFGKKSYVYVDLNRVVSAVSEEIAKKHDGEELDFTANIEKYRHKFNFEIDQYSRNYNSIVFTSSRPIAGAVDRTEFFIKKVLKNGG